MDTKRKIDFIYLRADEERRTSSVIPRSALFQNLIETESPLPVLSDRQLALSIGHFIFTNSNGEGSSKFNEESSIKSIILFFYLCLKMIES